MDTIIALCLVKHTQNKNKRISVFMTLKERPGEKFAFARMPKRALNSTTFCHISKKPTTKQYVSSCSAQLIFWVIFRVT